jgi:hypothetical protein
MPQNAFFANEYHFINGILAFLMSLRTIEGILIRRFEEKSAKTFSILFQDVLTDQE